MKERIKQLNAELQKLSAEARALYDEMDKKSEKGTKAYDGQSADVEKFNKLTADGETKLEELKRLQKQLEIDETVNRPADPAKAAPAAAAPVQRRSIGQRVIESEEYKQALVTKNLARVEMKDLNEGTPSAGGYLVFSDRQETLRELPQRPFSILDLVPIFPTSSNLVEIIVEGTTTSSADFVAEKALKPESNITFAQQQIPIKTIAHWVAITRQLLEDAARLRAYIDRRLLLKLRQKLEDKVISGNDAGFVGFTNAAGIQTRVHQTASNGMGAAGDNVFDTLRYAIADLALKFFRADVIALNPVQAAKMETTKDSQGRYLMQYDPVAQRLWRLRVVESHPLAAGTSLVLDSQMSGELYDRGTLAIYTGQPDDYFLRNQFAILAEGRYGFAVVYPDGVNKVTGL
ncbi:MAG TPA: phage major capsid protein [Blastocatellia bacterium]|nr:phage major capsid protein [Blastocatellia bacterium]